MTTRIVLVSALHHARATPRFHAENPLIAGSATCGTPLRRPYRAIAVDDERLCGMCFGDTVSQVGLSEPESARIAGRNSDPAVAQTATGSTHSLITQRAGFDES